MLEVSSSSYLCCYLIVDADCADSFGNETVVVGGLLGTQTGRDIEIMNSFEIVVNSATDADGNEELKVDHEYFTTRREQCKCLSLRISSLSTTSPNLHYLFC